MLLVPASCMRGLGFICYAEIMSVYAGIRVGHISGLCRDYVGLIWGFGRFSWHLLYHPQ